MTVRKRSGKVVVADGPFAETKEQLLGFVMLQAGSLDEALKIAGDIPIAEWGTIEVRACLRRSGPLTPPIKPLLSLWKRR